MRYLILSDIHSNLQALDAVLTDAAGLGYDRAIVLGDLVGYGADPAAVLARTLGLPPAAIVRGNHDKVCAGLEMGDGFGSIARAAAEWTAATLSQAERHQLAALPKGPQLVEEGLTICHGAPFNEDFYMIDAEDCQRALDATPARLCLFGHTHVPTMFTSDDRWCLPLPESLVSLPSDGKTAVNVGSVGQPRDGDPRASYGILDTVAHSIRVRRVEYDIATAQARIRQAGLPDALATRLALGL